MQEELRAAAPKRPARPPPGGNVSGEGGDLDRLGLRADDAGEGGDLAWPSAAVPSVAAPDSPYGSGLAALLAEASESSSESTWSSSEEEVAPAAPVAPAASSPYGPGLAGLLAASESESSSESTWSSEEEAAPPAASGRPYGAGLAALLAASDESSESSESTVESEEEEVAPAPAPAPAPRRPGFADRWGENSEVARLKGDAVPATARAPAPEEPRRRRVPGRSLLPLREGEGEYAQSGKLENGRTHWEEAGVQGEHRPGAWTGLVGGHGYENEETEAKHVPAVVRRGRNARTHYNTPEERDDTRLTGHRGRLVPAVDQNLPADTRGFDAKLSAVGDARGKANFAVADGGGVYGMNPQWGESETASEVAVSHHSSLLAGESVVTAGEITAEHGRVKEVTNNSGHYRPYEDTILDGLEAMDAEGIDLSLARVKAAGVGEVGRAGPYLQAQAGRSVPSAPYRDAKGAAPSPVEWRPSSLAPRAAMHEELAQKVAGRAAAAEGGAQAVAGKVDTKDAQARAEQRLTAAQTPEEREDAAFHLTDVLEQRDWEAKQPT